VARTGIASRFLLGDRDLSPFGRLALNLALGLASLAFVLGGLRAGGQALHTVVDAQSDLHRLGRSPTPLERTLGLVRQRAVVGTDTPPLGLSQLEHQHYVSGKNGGWRTDATLTESRLASLDIDGTRYTFASDRVALQFEPTEYKVLDPSYVATHLGDVVAAFPSGGRIRAQYANAGTPVFVEGCVVGPGVLGACRAGLVGREPLPLTLTLGDAGSGQPRIDHAANKLLLKLVWAGLGLLVPMLWLWFFLRARPVVDGLLQHTDKADTTPAIHWELGLIPVPLVMAAVQGFVAWRATPFSAWSLYRGGYTFAVAVACAAVALAATVWRRRMRLERAMQPVLDAKAATLREARGDRVEVCATVSPNAPTVLGPISQKPRAWLWISVWETSSLGKTTQTTRAFLQTRPSSIPVRDASGEGDVDPDGVEPDVRALVRQFRHGSERALTERLRADFGITLSPSHTHIRWWVEEGYLEPGEALYLLGACRRVEDPRAIASYRGDASRALLHAGAGQLILHAGTERSLLSLLRRELTLLQLLGAALVGTALSLLGLSLLLVAQ